jgi:hypothetical protein
MPAVVRLVICFLVLPLVPLATLIVTPEGHIPVVRDRIIVISLVGVGSAVVSGVLGYRARGNPAAGLLYAVATAALSIVSIVLFIGVLFAVHCSEGDTSGAC